MAAIIVGLVVARMGLQFGWTALSDLMDRAADDDVVAALRAAMLDTPGGARPARPQDRKMGDMVLVDVHLEIRADLTVERGHAIAAEARRRAMLRDDVLNVMTRWTRCRPRLPLRRRSPAAVEAPGRPLGRRACRRSCG